MSSSATASANRRRAARRFAVTNERPLHAALKEWYVRPYDRLEAPVDGFVIDIVRGDLLIEIQTASMSAMKRKLEQLVPRHRVRVVHPIAQSKWLVKQPADGAEQRPERRRSPKKGRVEDLFHEMVSLAHLAGSPNFTLEVLLTDEEEVRRHTPGRCWRRKGWTVEERRLLGVAGQRFFECPADYAALLPEELPAPFTTADIAEGLGAPRLLAQRMAYCLRRMQAIAPVGRSRKGVLYEGNLTRKVASAGERVEQASRLF